MKLKTVIVAILMVISEMSDLKAVTVLPAMKAADDFGGAEIANLDNFVSGIGDYTIEAEATAGTTITIL